MKEQQYDKLQYYYRELERELQAICTGLPFHLDGPEYDTYCYMILHPHRVMLYDRMLSVANDEDFEQALAIQRFIQNRLSRY